MAGRRLLSLGGGAEPLQADCAPPWHPPAWLTPPPRRQVQTRPARSSLRFLKFGALAWGGPAAQIAMIKRECVDEEGWVDEETFKKTLAVYQVLPGPEAHELCVYFGRIRGGKLGGFLAGLGFMLPGFLLMLGALGPLRRGGPRRASRRAVLRAQGGGRRAGRPGARPAEPLVHHRRSARADRGRGLRADAACVASFVLVLLGAGLAYELWTNAAAGRGGHTRSRSAAAVLRRARRRGHALAYAEIFCEGLKAGLRHLRRRLHRDPLPPGLAVDGKGWLTEDQFVDGLAIGGVLPAPLIIFSTFVGYLAGGLAGGLAMTLGIFLPASSSRSSSTASSSRSPRTRASARSCSASPRA